MDESKRKSYIKLLGISVGLFTIYTFVSIVSFLFTWKQDQIITDAGEAVSNAGASFGYALGKLLVSDLFGLGSFALVLLLGFISYRILYINRKIGLLRSAITTIMAAIIISLVLSYFSLLVSDNTCFYGGLGGEFGATFVLWLETFIGKIGFFFFIIVCVLLWLFTASNKFMSWFSKLGDIVKKDEVPIVEQNTEDESIKGDDGIFDLQTEDQEEESPKDVQFADNSTKTIYDTPVVHQEEVKVEQVENENVDENEDEIPIEIEPTEKLDSTVREELPWINQRDELKDFVFPSLDLLDNYSDFMHEVSQEELLRNRNKIKAKLMDFKIQIDKVTATVGATVTLYKLYCAPGVKISSIKNLDEDIAIALGVSTVRIVRLTDSVGVEVANDRASVVPLKSVLNDDNFRNNKYELPVAIGCTITQKVKVFDLADAPHLLVAGATKQGKSVGLNVIISSLLYAKHPSELKFVFIDPKFVEFRVYARLLNHYLAILPTAASEEDEMNNAIIKEPKQAEEVLRSLCVEMDERYTLLYKAEVNNIKSYNEKYKKRFLNPNEGHKHLPYLVVVIDEYSDLTSMSGTTGEARAKVRSITNSIVRLAQKGRAAGLHVIIATQRPSVDVITGLIKTNFPTRIAFRTITRIDSGTILDAPGAEKLIGRGDMLYYAGVETERVQCALVEMEEIIKVTNFISSQKGYMKSYSTPYYLPSVENEDSASSGVMVDMKNIDEMFEEAALMVVTAQQGSTSNLQRKLGMGYARAGKVMDQLEAAGIVGPQDGSKARQVLVGDLSELSPILKAYLNNGD